MFASAWANRHQLDHLGGYNRADFPLDPCDPCGYAASVTVTDTQRSYLAENFGAEIESQGYALGRITPPPLAAGAVATEMTENSKRIAYDYDYYYDYDYEHMQKVRL